MVIKNFVDVSIIQNKESQRLYKNYNGDSQLYLYFKEISNHKILSIAEEKELMPLIRENNSQALNKLILSNLKFVVSVSRNYQNQGLNLSDLINEGNIGLIRAAKNYDESQNYKFITYAVWWIKQSIIMALAEQSRTIKIPVYKINILQKIKNSIIHLEQKFGRNPTLEEITLHTELELKEILNYEEIKNPCKSLENSIPEENSKWINSIHDDQQRNPEFILIEKNLKSEIENALTSITERESNVLKLYFGLGTEVQLTLDEVGFRLNLTRERVRQIKEKALAKLKQIKYSSKFSLYK